MILVESLHTMAGRRHSSIIPLSHDHREALGLAFRLHHPAPPGRVTPMTPASTEASRARETLEFFERHLRPHFHAEEEHLFPFFEECLGRTHPTIALVARLRDEHRALGEIRDQLESAVKSGGDVGPVLAAFADLLEAHVRTEERQLFAIFPEEAAEERVAELATEILGALGRTS